MKKRGLASLLIVSIIAIAAVFGVVFAFQNAGLKKDVYGSVTVTVDKPNIELEIELEKDETADGKLRIVETPLSSTEFTITVGGLAEDSDGRVELNKSSIDSGMVTVDRVTPEEESANTGVNTFRVTGQNGGAPITMTFTTYSGAKTIGVNVSVKMVAKDMKVAPTAHFGVRQGADGLNLLSTDVLSKFNFYAHADDIKGEYTPNSFPVEYRLKPISESSPEKVYPGVILEQGILTVTKDALCVDQYIDLQAKLPDMDHWVDIPCYVFPAVSKIMINTDAHDATSKDDKIWDLIANRTEYSSATFEFMLDCQKTQYSDYGFSVQSADVQIARVDHLTRYERSISTVKNLGEVAINVTAYPIVIVDGKEIAYSDSSDANVQIKDTFFLRVRNEFHLFEESEIYGTETFYLKPDKETINAFQYEGDYYTGDYRDTFKLDTFNKKTVNFDNDVEFELLVDDQAGNAGNKSGVYGWNPQNNPQNISLYDVLNISYWSAETNDWVALSAENDKYYTNYLNTFSVSFVKTAVADDFLSNNMTLKLGVKSVSVLTNGQHATCEINLDVTSAIDEFEVNNLVEFSDGATGIALVYDTKHQEFSMEQVDVYGLIVDKIDADGNAVAYKYSQSWNTGKITDNRGDLPFTIVSTPKSLGKLYYTTYSITASDISSIEYYQDYPLTIEYPNGKKFTFNVRVYPTVESLSMSVISNNRGKIYQTITDFDDTSYEYVRTVYVRKGYAYEFAVDTQGVNVGAFAMFDKIVDVNGNTKSSESSKMFDAINLSEGLYECSVSLHAYINSVYVDKREISRFMS